MGKDSYTELKELNHKRKHCKRQQINQMIEDSKKKKKKKIYLFIFFTRLLKNNQFTIFL